MKLEALDHPKTLDFASRLGVELPTAIGHLELFWAFTGKKSPQGNVGKWPDGAISMACYWRGAADKFVAALVDAGFLDADSQHRLLVHDWRDHAPNWVKAKLIKLKLQFLDVRSGVPTAVPTAVATAVHTSEGSTSRVDAEKVPTAEPAAVATAEPSSRARVLPSEAKGSVYTLVDRQRGEPDPDQAAFEQVLQRTFPKVSRPNWATALHHARNLVETGRATWPQLVAAVRRYAAYCSAPGMEWYTVMGPVNFFSAVDDPWSLQWDPPAKPPTDAERRKAAEAAELIALADGRAARGLLHFRDPKPDESAAVYATQLRLEEQALRSKPKGAAAGVVSALSAAKAMPK